MKYLYSRTYYTTTNACLFIRLPSLYKSQSPNSNRYLLSEPRRERNVLRVFIHVYAHNIIVRFVLNRKDDRTVNKGYCIDLSYENVFTRMTTIIIIIIIATIPLRRTGALVNLSRCTMYYTHIVIFPFGFRHFFSLNRRSVRSNSIFGHPFRNSIRALYTRYYICLGMGRAIVYGQVSCSDIIIVPRNSKSYFH